MYIILDDLIIVTRTIDCFQSLCFAVAINLLKLMQCIFCTLVSFIVIFVVVGKKQKAS